MTLSMSKIAVLADNSIDWLNNLDENAYQIDEISFIDNDFSNIADIQHHLLLIQDDIKGLDVEAILVQLNRSQPLLSIIILTQNTKPEYSLNFIELGARDVFVMSDNSEYLIRRLKLAIKYNHSKRLNIRLIHDLNAVTILSRRLHNANHPNNLIVDALNILSTTFNLMGVVIILERGSHFHIRAGNSSRDANRRVYDNFAQLHPYDPIQQSILKNITFVFEDLSVNQFIVDVPIFDNLYSAIIVPLIYSNITLGALMALGNPTNPLTRDDIVIYEHLATHLGSAYQNVRDAYTQDVSAKTSRHLLRTWQSLSKVYTAEEVIETMRTLASEISSIKNSLIWMYSETSSQPTTYASNSETIRIFQDLYSTGIITEYINQFDTQLRSLTIWLGRSNTRDIGDLFQIMEGQQLIFIPIKDEARLLGCILASSNSTDPISVEDVSLLEGISHAAGQTLARNMLILYKDEQAERLEAITRSIRDGIFFVAENQIVVFCNPQFTELTGISPSQVLNQSLDSLIDKMVSQSSKPEQIRLDLESAIHQVNNNSIDKDYPIIEINIPKTQSKIYMELIALSEENSNVQKNWIGIIRSDRADVSNFDIPFSLLDSFINYLQTLSQTTYENVISLKNISNNTAQTNLLNQVQQNNFKIEQLLNNMQNIYKSNEHSFAWDDPNKLLSIVLSKPFLRNHVKQLDVKTSIKGKNIYVNKKLIIQIMENLIGSAIQLADKTTATKIQLSLQADKLMFLVITKGRIISPNQINQILESPNHNIKDLPYSFRLLLFFSNQLALEHDGLLAIKPSLSQGMQFHLIIPISESNQDKVQPLELQESVPERKPSTIIIYDNDPLHEGVDYEFLAQQGYELVYCNELHQIHSDLNMIRIDLIILANRQYDYLIGNYIKQLRQKWNVTKPILLLSIDNSEERRIQSIQDGVDTYLQLPISNIELITQAKNLFERSKLPERVQEPLIVGQLYVDFAQRQVAVEGKSIELTRIEYELLSHLALNIGQTLSHSELLTEVWGPEYRDEKQYLWVNMSRLRRKLENTQNKTRYIFTQPGVGYILKVDK